MKQTVIFTLIVFLAGGLLQIAEAQRGAPSRDERRQQRRQENENLTPEQRRQNWEARWNERLKSATPEQRQRMIERREQMQERMREQGLDPNDPNSWGQMMRDGRGERASQEKADQMRAAMIAAGILDKAVQDEIIAFVLRQDAARAELLRLAQTAAQTLIRPEGGVQTVADDGTPVRVPPSPESNAAVQTAFAAYETALGAERTRYGADLKQLDEKIQFSTTPRIKAFLSLVGITDMETHAIGGPEVVFSAPEERRGGRNRRADARGERPGEPNPNGEPNENGAENREIEAPAPVEGEPAP